MKFRTILLLIFLYSLSSFAQIQEPVKWTFEKKVTGKTTADIILKAQIDKGWHIYGMTSSPEESVPTSFTITTIENAKKVGGIVPKSKLINSKDGDGITYYENEAVFVQKISFTDEKSVYVKGQVRFMSCNDQTCLAPTNEDFSFGKPGMKPVAEPLKEEAKPIGENQVKSLDLAADGKESDSVSNNVKLPVQTIQLSEKEKDALWTPVVEQLKALGEDNQHSSLWLIFFAGMLGGLIALFTPCVWPIIPMTVSFFLKRSGNKSKGRRDAMLYGVAIIVIYVTLGLLITAIFGGSALNDLSTNAVFNLIFFALLVVFAISFFGAFEITLPSSWANKMDAKADSTSGILSILFMAFTLALVSFSCTGPIIGTLLVQVGTSGNILAPAVGMFGFALALAIPFSFFAFFPTLLKSMPKSGGWMNKIKVTLAFLELALSLKFLSVADLAYGWRILDREVFISLWIVIFALLGIYLIGKLRFAHDDDKNHTSVTGLFLGIVSLAFAIYMVPGLWGAPLKAISAFSPPSTTQDFNLNKNEVHAKFNDYDLGMAYAKQMNKPAIIDFTGFGCVNCRKMEVNIWTNDIVKNKLNDDFVLISLFVDDKTPLAEPYAVEENGKTREIKTIGDKWSYLQRHKFGINAQPFYVMLNDRGMPLTKSIAFTEKPQYFIDWLNSGVK